MVTWADIRRWQPAPLQEAVGMINGEYNKLVPASEDLRKLATPYGWTGDAASAAANKVNEMVDRLEAWAAEIQAGRHAATAVGDAIIGVRNGATEAEDLAAAQNFTIGDDGAVIDNGPPPGVPIDQQEAVAAERQAVAAELRERVRQVLCSAEDVDSDFCSVLDRILNHQVIDSAGNDNSSTSLAAAGVLGLAAGGLTIPPPPPEGATAAQNAAYWATLSDQQRRQLAMDHPALVGPRDGFTATHRDIANRILVKQERARLEGELERLREENKTHVGPGGEIERQYNSMEMRQIERQLEALDKVDSMTLHPNGEPDPDRQLLMLDLASGEPKAAIAQGDVDTAEHVAVFTPGMNTTLDGNFSDYVAEMDDLREVATQQLDSFGQGGEVATVTWLGYEPPTFSLPDSLPDVVTGQEAGAGGAKLAQFYDGINESRVSDPHMTALGHSFGSLTQGIALTQDTGVDDAVFFGSPGISANPAPYGQADVGNLQVPEGHSYNLEADGDAVADIPDIAARYGYDLASMPGVNQLSTHEAVDASGRPLLGVTGHGEYAKMENGAASTSLYNMANVVAGMPEYTIAAP
jgi:hypothetical protein